MTSRVALVMAPLLPRIRTGVGNMGLENGGGGSRGFKEIERAYLLSDKNLPIVFIENVSAEPRTTLVEGGIEPRY